jgi:polysaccharide export outer membrane protein
VRTDLIRPGDTLTVAIYEVGVSLFSGQQAATTANVETGPSANAQRITVQVRDDGTIDLPYIGTLKADGTYPEGLAATIKQRLRRYSESPEAIVAITDSVESVAYVTGYVPKSGRYRLSSAREKLLDIITLAGGSSIDPADAEVRIARGERVASIPLSELRPEDLADITVAPGDRIQVLKRRRSYTVFGATDRISQVPFESESVTLAEAIARVGGPADSRADARSVYLFRFEAAAAGGKPQPVIYHLSLIEPDSYFAAQLFHMQDKDVMLFANAEANLPTKFLGVINQLFAPVVTVRAATTTGGF